MSHDQLRRALADWRAAEQRLASCVAGSPEWNAARDAVEAAQRRYRALATGDDADTPEGGPDEAERPNGS
jgi:hypothetical protein